MLFLRRGTRRPQTSKRSNDRALDYELAVAYRDYVIMLCYALPCYVQVLIVHERSTMLMVFACQYGLCR